MTFCLVWVGTRQWLGFFKIQDGGEDGHLIMKIGTSAQHMFSGL